MYHGLCSFRIVPNTIIRALSISVQLGPGGGATCTACRATEIAATGRQPVGDERGGEVVGNSSEIEDRRRLGFIRDRPASNRERTVAGPPQDLSRSDKTRRGHFPATETGRADSPQLDTVRWFIGELDAA